MSDTISSIKLASDYNLVYVNLLTASLASPLPLRNQLKELNYYEDIYSSTIYGELVLNDATNIISNLRLNGTEFIEFKFQKTTNDNVSIERTFRVYKIGDRLTDASKNQESFIIYFCSEELMISERYRISKAYRNTPISMIVEDIFTNYLKLTPMTVGMTRPTQAQTKLYYIDPTLGIYDFILPNKKIFETIHWLSLYSRPANFNPGADFLFFENINGYNFVSLQTLFSKDAFKSLYYNPQNISIEIKDQAINVIHMEVVKFFDVLEATSQGTFHNRVITIDPLTRNIFANDFLYNQYFALAKTLNMSPLTTSLQNRWGDTMYYPPNDIRTEAGALRIVPGNYNQKTIFKNPIQNDSVAHDVHVQDYLPNRVAQLGLNNYMKIKVSIPGDSQIYVGMKLQFNCFDLTPTQSTTPNSDSKGLDVFYSGYYLVTAVRHIINNTEYQTIIEMIKESFGSDKSEFLPAPPNPLTQGFKNAVNGIQNVKS